jgi:hypothetical protein
MYWQLYDYYLIPTAGYYAVKKACSPIQLIYDLTGFRASDLFVFMKLTSADGVITNSYAVVTVKNTSDKIAYQVILKLKDKDGCLMSPVFWSDNFFALQPGEEYTVTCRTTDDIQGIVECEWWN